MEELEPTAITAIWRRKTSTEGGGACTLPRRVLLTIMQTRKSITVSATCHALVWLTLPSPSQRLLLLLSVFAESLGVRVLGYLSFFLSVSAHTNGLLSSSFSSFLSLPSIPHPSPPDECVGGIVRLFSVTIWLFSNWM